MPEKILFFSAKLSEPKPARQVQEHKKISLNNSKKALCGILSEE
jgi:hypothetical protein